VKFCDIKSGVSIADDNIRGYNGRSNEEDGAYGHDHAAWKWVNIKQTIEEVGREILTGERCMPEEHEGGSAEDRNSRYVGACEEDE
jgi:hypothetical protein